MRPFVSFSALTAICVLFATACGTSSPSASSNGTAETKVVDVVIDGSTDGIALADASHEDFRELLKQHEGKVIFVDYWATWCPNCMEEFPHTVELAKKHADGLAVISVAMEMDPKDAETRNSVREFLTKQGAAFDNLLFTGDGTTEEATAGFEIDSALPHFQLYDRTGKLIRKFTYSDADNPLSPEDIDKAVAEALAAPKG